MLRSLLLIEAGEDRPAKHPLESGMAISGTLNSETAGILARRRRDKLRGTANRRGAADMHTSSSATEAEVKIQNSNLSLHMPRNDLNFHND